MPTPLRLLVLVLALLVAGSVGRSASADWTLIDDRWFELSLAGKPCGSIHAMTEAEGDRVRSTRTMQMRLARGETKVEISSQTIFLETAKGEPIEASMRQAMGGAPVETTFVFTRDGNEWKVAIRDNTASREKRVPVGGWLTPAALERFVRDRMKAGAREITYQSIDVETGLEVVSVVMQKKGNGQANIDHEPAARTIPISIWSSVDSLQKLDVTERYASDGLLVDSTAKLGIGELKTRFTSKEKAIEASQKSGAEVLVNSFVPAKRRIFGVMEKTSLALRISAKEGEISEFPSVGAQRVTRTGPNEIRVEIEADRGSAPVGDEATNPVYLARSTLIDGSDPAVRAIFDAALPKDDPAAATRSSRDTAEILRRATEAALPNKNLACAFASAAEAAKLRGGDCSEHGVLLAALLREAGIPARIAVGLVYADQFAGEKNVWAWHVWTQALLPTRDGTGLEWVDYDATLPVRFHAAHLCVAVGALEAGATDPMWTGTLSLIGNLSILDLLGEDAPKRNAKEPAAGKPTS